MGPEHEGASRSRKAARRVGLRVMVPGLPQWSWGHERRSRVLIGFYASALAVALFAWGSAVGAAMLGFAILTHIASVADAIRRTAFPGFGPWAPWMSASIGVGTLGYLPAVTVAVQLACPVGNPQDGYLVNRWAYRDREPQAGEWIWLESDLGDGSARSVARVVAVEGQHVLLSNQDIQIDGDRLEHSVVDGSRSLCQRMAFEVPPGQLLVVCPPRSGRWGGRFTMAPDDLRLVSRDAALGRAWVRYYPIWSRSLAS